MQENFAHKRTILIDTIVTENDAAIASLSKVIMDFELATMRSLISSLIDIKLRGVSTTLCEFGLTRFVPHEKSFELNQMY